MTFSPQSSTAFHLRPYRDCAILSRVQGRVLEHRRGYGRQNGSWIPEHVRLAVVRALQELPDRSTPETHRKVAVMVRRAHPALPISDRELLSAIEKLAEEAKPR